MLSPGAHKIFFISFLRPSLLKAVAGMMGFLFLTQDLLYGASLTAALPQPMAYKIPASLGRIESYHRGTSDKTIVFVQDAHDSIEAQMNIAGIIRHSVAKYGVKTVFEEGYEGPVPTDEVYKSLTEPRTREAVSYYLLDHLRIGGAEYAHINRESIVRSSKLEVRRKQTKIQREKLLDNDGSNVTILPTSNFQLQTQRTESFDFKLIGADSIKGHFENVRWFRRSVKEKAPALQDIDLLISEFQRLADERFPKPIKAYLKLKQSFDAEQIDLVNYLKRARPLAPKDATYSSIDLLLTADQVNRPAMREQIKNIAVRVLFEELQRMDGDISANFFSENRRPLTTSHDTATHSHITPPLAGEDKGGGKALRDSNVLRVDTARQIYLSLQHLSSVKRLLDFKMTPAELRAVKQGILEFDTKAMAQMLVQETKRSAVFSKTWEESVRNAIQFYESALKREAAAEIQLNVFLNQSDEKTAVLVYGGFHRQGIEALLSRNNVSYYVVSPKMSGLDERHSKLYRHLMERGYALNPISGRERSAISSKKSSGDKEKGRGLSSATADKPLPSGSVSLTLPQAARPISELVKVRVGDPAAFQQLVSFHRELSEAARTVLRQMHKRRDPPEYISARMDQHLRALSKRQHYQRSEVRQPDDSSMSGVDTRDFFQKKEPSSVIPLAIPDDLKKTALKKNPRLANTVDWEEKLGAIRTALGVTDTQLLDFFRVFPLVLTYTPAILKRKWVLINSLSPRAGIALRWKALRALAPLNTDGLEMIFNEAQKQKKVIKNANHLRRLYEQLNTETKRIYRKTAAGYLSLERGLRRGFIPEETRSMAAPSKPPSDLLPLVANLVKRMEKRSEVRSTSAILGEDWKKVRALGALFYPLMRKTLDEKHFQKSAVKASQVREVNTALQSILPPEPSGVLEQDQELLSRAKLTLRDLREIAFKVYRVKVPEFDASMAGFQKTAADIQLSKAWKHSGQRSGAALNLTVTPDNLIGRLMDIHYATGDKKLILLGNLVALGAAAIPALSEQFYRSEEHQGHVFFDAQAVAAVAIAAIGGEEAKAFIPLLRTVKQYLEVKRAEDTNDRLIAAFSWALERLTANHPSFLSLPVSLLRSEVRGDSTESKVERYAFSSISAEKRRKVIRTMTAINTASQGPLWGISRILNEMADMPSAFKNTKVYIALNDRDKPVAYAWFAENMFGSTVTVNAIAVAGIQKKAYGTELAKIIFDEFSSSPRQEQIYGDIRPDNERSAKFVSRILKQLDLSQYEMELTNGLKKQNPENAEEVKMFFQQSWGVDNVRVSIRKRAEVRMEGQRSELITKEEADHFFNRVRTVLSALPQDLGYQNTLGYEFVTAEQTARQLGDPTDETNQAVAKRYLDRGWMMGSESVDYGAKPRPIHSRVYWIDVSNPSFRFSSLLENIKRGIEVVAGVYDQRDFEQAVALVEEYVAGTPSKPKAATLGLAAFDSWRGLVEDTLTLDHQLIRRSEERGASENVGKSSNDLNKHLLEYITADTLPIKNKKTNEMRELLISGSPKMRKNFKELLLQLLSNAHEYAALRALGSTLRETDAGQRARLRKLYELFYDKKGRLRKEIPVSGLTEVNPASTSVDSDSWAVKMGKKVERLTLERVTSQLRVTDVEQLKKIFAPHNTLTVIDQMWRHGFAWNDYIFHIVRNKKNEIVAYAWAHLDRANGMLGLAAVGVTKTYRKQGVAAWLRLKQMDIGLRQGMNNVRTHIASDGRRNGWHWSLLKLGFHISALRFSGMDSMFEGAANKALEASLSGQTSQTKAKQKAALEKVLKQFPDASIVMGMTLSYGSLGRFKNALQQTRAKRSEVRSDMSKEGPLNEKWLMRKIGETVLSDVPGQGLSVSIRNQYFDPKDPDLVLPAQELARDIAQALRENRYSFEWLKKKTEERFAEANTDFSESQPFYMFSRPTALIIHDQIIQPFIASKRYAQTLQQLNGNKQPVPNLQIDHDHWIEAVRYPILYDLLSNLSLSPEGEALKVLVLGPGRKRIPNSGKARSHSPQMVEILTALLGLKAEYTVVDGDPSVLTVAVNPQWYQIKGAEFSRASSDFKTKLRKSLGGITERKFLSRLKNGNNVFRVDPKLIAQAKIDTHWGLFENLEYGEEQLDAVIATTSLLYALSSFETVEASLDFTARLIRALKPGGKIFLSKSTLYKGLTLRGNAETGIKATLEKTDLPAWKAQETAMAQILGLPQISFEQRMAYELEQRLGFKVSFMEKGGIQVLTRETVQSESSLLSFSAPASSLIPTRSEMRMISDYQIRETFGADRVGPMLSGGRNEEFLYESGRKVAVRMPWAKFIYRALDVDGNEIPDRVYKITHYATDNEMLFEEARLLFKLSHEPAVPGVPRLVRAGMMDIKKSGGMWIEQEGLSDAHSLEREVFGRVPRLFEILIRAGEIIKQVHVRGIAHADLKPAQFLINAAQELQLIDFGNAREIGSAEARDNYTTGYVPVDRAGEPITTGLAEDTDIYSFVIMIAELLGHQTQSNTAEGIAPLLRRMRDEYLHLILEDWNFDQVQELWLPTTHKIEVKALERKKWPASMDVILHKLRQDLLKIQQGAGRSEVRSTEPTPLFQLPEERLTPRGISLILTHLGEASLDAPYDNKQAVRPAVEKLMRSGLFLPAQTFEYVFPGHPSYLEPDLERVVLRQDPRVSREEMYRIPNLDTRVFILTGGGFQQNYVRSSKNLPQGENECKYCAYHAYSNLLQVSADNRGLSESPYEVHLAADALYSHSSEFYGGGDGWWVESHPTNPANLQRGFRLAFHPAIEARSLTYQTVVIENGQVSMLAQNHQRPRLINYLWAGTDEMLAYFEKRIVRGETDQAVRSEVRKSAVVAKMRRVEKIENFSTPTGVFLEANDLAGVPENQVTAQIDEIMALLSRHKHFDLYVHGEIESVHNRRFRELLEQYRSRIHFGVVESRASLQKKQILVKASFLESRDSETETRLKLKKLKEDYGLTQELTPLEYTSAGALKGFLDLAESLKAEEIRDLPARYAVKTASGYLRMAESYLTSVWQELQNTYVFAWSA